MIFSGCLPYGRFLSQPGTSKEVMILEKVTSNIENLELEAEKSLDAARVKKEKKKRPKGRLN